jgi:gliding-associated putative ABC transporter substrate-binding component GldG
MVVMKKKSTGEILILLISMTLLVLINILGARHFQRWDLTEENRYTINPSTKKMLSKLDDQVYVEVYLTGDLNPDFKRLQRSIEETLAEFNIYSNNQVQYSFNDPTLAMDQKAQNEFIQHLTAMGITPTRLYDNEDGKETQKIIFPGAVISYGGREVGVTLLKSGQAASAIEKLNLSIEALEYQFASTIAKLTNIERMKIGLVKGHGELDSANITGLQLALSESYLIEDIRLSQQQTLDQFNTLIIAKPRTAFSEQDKYQLDQYVMGGGSVLFMLDKLAVNMDSISTPFNYAFPYELNLDDLLFKYGVRINNNLVQDRVAGTEVVVVGNIGEQPQVQPFRWPFYPIINQYSDHVVVKNLDAVLTKFVSTIDTIKAEGVRKTPIMFTSEYSRSLSAPVQVSLAYIQTELTPEKLNKKHLPVGYLLEGQFTSLFKNRFAPNGGTGQNQIDTSVSTKIAVIADGDIARNDVSPASGQPLDLGYDAKTRTTFANKDLILNIISYLSDGDGLISARSKEIKIRPLDNVKTANEGMMWKITNLLLPIVFLILFGIVKHYLRKRKYANF